MFLALAVIRIFQKKLSSNNISITPSKIGKIFPNFSASYVISGDKEYYLSNNEYPLYQYKNKDEESYYVKYQEITESQLKCLGFTPVKGVCNLSDLRKYFHIKTLNQYEYQKNYVDFSKPTCPPIKG